MNKKSRFLALVGVLGIVALTGAVGAEGAIVKAPVETFCMCACPGSGVVVCVGSINGDCSVPCAQAVATLCPSDM